MVLELLWGSARVCCRQTRVHRLVWTRVPLKTSVSQQVPRRGLSSLPGDVTLFHHDRTRFFRVLAFFCGGQVVFWTYLAHFAYTELRDTGGSSNTSADASTWSLQMNLGSCAWRYGFTALCACVAAGICGLAHLFCRRSVQQVVLYQGGRMVRVTTQSVAGPGRGKSISAPLGHVACFAHRDESKTFIPLKIRGHRFYFLLDKDGTITNIGLFDRTVGSYRRF